MYKAQAFTLQKNSTITASWWIFTLGSGLCCRKSICRLFVWRHRPPTVFYFKVTTVFLTFGHSGAQPWAPVPECQKYGGYMWNKRRSYFKIISVFYFTLNTSHIISKLFQPLKLFQNYLSDIEHVGKHWWVAISLWSNSEIILLHMCVTRA